MDRFLELATVDEGTLPGYEPLPMPRPDPSTPSALQAARIVDWAWADPDWGMLVSGATLPTITDLAERHGVAPNTAHRAIAELASENLVTVSRGRLAVVAQACRRLSDAEPTGRRRDCPAGS